MGCNPTQLNYLRMMALVFDFIKNLISLIKTLFLFDLINQQGRIFHFACFLNLFIIL